MLLSYCHPVGECNELSNGIWLCEPLAALFFSDFRRVNFASLRTAGMTGVGWLMF